MSGVQTRTEGRVGRGVYRIRLPVDHQEGTSPVSDSTGPTPKLTSSPTGRGYTGVRRWTDLGDRILWVWWSIDTAWGRDYEPSEPNSNTEIRTRREFPTTPLNPFLGTQHESVVRPPSVRPTPTPPLRRKVVTDGRVVKKSTTPTSTERPRSQSHFGRRDDQLES